jgi:hypothetical protein
VDCFAGEFYELLEPNYDSSIFIYLKLETKKILEIVNSITHNDEIDVVYELLEKYIKSVETVLIRDVPIDMTSEIQMTTCDGALIPQDDMSMLRIAFDIYKQAEYMKLTEEERLRTPEPIKAIYYFDDIENRKALCRWLNLQIKPIKDLIDRYKKHSGKEI